MVQRADGGKHETVLRPKVQKHLMSRNGRPDIGASYGAIANTLVVGELVPEVYGMATPAVGCGYPGWFAYPGG